jgi:hypothetical protein
MGTIWVREFTGGLDNRRMPEATSGGVLIRANNGHITRGGEFEQRAAFVPTYALPAGTVGMFSDRSSVVVFGHLAAPVGLPSGVAYQRLQHSTPAIALVRILSADLYAGKIYAVGEFADGAIFHFYDGARVTDWFDGRARATFEVVGGAVTPAIAATGSFEVTGGTVGGGNQISSVTIDGVNVLGAAVAHTGNNATTAAAVAAQINSYSSSPEYTATSIGQTVRITAAVAGTTPNGKAVVPVVGGTATVGNISNMAGGAATTTSRATDIKINGVSIISAPVLWTTSNEDTAQAIATAINSFTSTPDYTASAVGASVSIAAATTGPAPNGFVVAFTLVDGLDVTPDAPVMANGASSTNTYQPGEFVRTIAQKMYSVSGPNMHFSGIKAPTKWTTDAVGAGFIDMSSESSGSEELTALARYQNFVAVFAARNVQIWYVDPDPELNRISQVLNNTGTDSPRSVTAFGDTDLFYLDESGLRSLRARDSSNAAATTDIGVPVDELISAKLETLTENERRQVVGLIEPKNGRFWLIMRDVAFVFSFFNGAKVSAWSTYDMSFIEDGETTSFSVDEALVFNRRVHLRAGDMIYVYGGLVGNIHDDTVAEAWLPYLDADDPTRMKEFNGLDVVLRGLWEVAAAMDPQDETTEDIVGTFDETTYNREKNPFNHQATHVSLRFRSQGVRNEGTEPHRLGACVLHYESSEDKD